MGRAAAGSRASRRTQHEALRKPPCPQVRVEQGRHQADAALCRRRRSPSVRVPARFLESANTYPLSCCPVPVHGRSLALAAGGPTALLRCLPASWSRRKESDGSDVTGNRVPLHRPPSPFCCRVGVGLLGIVNSSDAPGGVRSASPSLGRQPVDSPESASREKGPWGNRAGVFLYGARNIYVQVILIVRYSIYILKYSPMLCIVHVLRFALSRSQNRKCREA